MTFHPFTITHTPLPRGRWENYCRMAPTEKRQRKHTVDVYAVETKSFVETLAPFAGVRLGLTKGPEAGAFMQQDEDLQTMLDAHLRTDLRFRL